MCTPARIPSYSSPDDPIPPRYRPSTRYKECSTVAVLEKHVFAERGAALARARARRTRGNVFRGGEVGGGGHFPANTFCGKTKVNLGLSFSVSETYLV